MPGYLYLQQLSDVDVTDSQGRGDVFIGSVPPNAGPRPRIKGGATSPGYVDQIRLMGLQFGLDVDVKRITLEEARQIDTEEAPSWLPPEHLRPEPSLGQKYWLNAGDPALNPLVVTKRTDRSSVALLEAASRAIKLFGWITLTSEEQDSEDAYLAIYLGGVLVSQAEAAWQDDGTRPLERWVLCYEKIQWSFQWTPSADQLWFGWNVLSDEAVLYPFGSLDQPLG